VNLDFEFDSRAFCCAFALRVASDGSDRTFAIATTFLRENAVPAQALDLGRDAFAQRARRGERAEANNANARAGTHRMASGEARATPVLSGMRRLRMTLHVGAELPQRARVDEALRRVLKIGFERGAWRGRPWVPKRWLRQPP
jgi:hypothetical protein